MNDAELREKEFDRVSRKVDPVRTAEMSSPVATTNNYDLVDASKIQPEGRERLEFIVEETENSNAIDARVVKRTKDDQGNFSPWHADGGTNASTTSVKGGTVRLEPEDTDADEYGVEVKPNSSNSQGKVKIWGVARAKH